jgi:polyphosphate glucokinase
MKGAMGNGAAAFRNGPRTLAIDIGGTGIKASVLDRAGRMLVKRVRVATPHPCRPEILLLATANLTTPLLPFDRISIGFPGVIRDGRVITAPHFDMDAWRDYPLQEAVARRFGKPARLLNNAEVQGLGIVAGRGLEVVLTLGTGVGSAVFSNGALAPHLELAQHPIRKGKTYNGYIGSQARLAHSAKKWNRRVLRMIEIVDSLLHYDVLYLGGGNAANVVVDLPDNVRIASNDTGITGGVRLWDENVWQAVGDRQARTRGDASAILRFSRPVAPPRRRLAPRSARAAMRS